MRLLHTHLPKTAGASLLAVLRLQYKQQVLAIPARDWQLVTPGEAQAHQVISGHYPFGTPEERWGIEHGRYITFLREPVARAGSLWGYIQRRGKHHHGFEYVSRMDAQTFAERGPFDNCQTRMLAGRPDFQWFDDKDPVGQDDLDRAIANLETFWFVGDVEHFRADMYALGDRLAWAPFVIPHVNASLSKPRIKLTEAFLDKWEWDLRLYDYWVSNRSLVRSTT